MNRKQFMRTITRIPFLVLTLALVMSILPEAMAQRFFIFGLTNQVWKYDSTNDWYTPTGTGWTTNGFDDSAWPSGRALLSSDPNALIVALRGTVIRDLRNPLPGVPGSTANQAVYFRTHFNWPSNASPAAQLILTCRIDDGCAVYLNGHRVGGLRMGDPVGHGSFSTALVPCQDPSGNNDATCDEVIVVDGTYLVDGDNVLAVTAHSNNSTSSDMTWGCQLEGVIPFAPRILDSTQPTNRTIVQSRPTTLMVVADGTPTPTYQWFKDGLAIDPMVNPTATNSALVISRMSSADAGDYYATVNNPLGTTNSRTATVAYLADTAGPRPVRAVGSPTFDKIYIEYDEVVDPTTSTDGVNYAISPLLNLTADPVLVLGGNIVVLTTDPQTPGTLYTVTITDVYDLAGNNIAAPNNTAQLQAWVNSGACSGVFLEAYNGVASTIAAFTNLPVFPNNPFTNGFINRFHSRAMFPDNGLANYGARMRALFIPLVTSNWRFWISTDDPGQLFLNPAGTSPAGRTLIAFENGCCGLYSNAITQVSAPIPLTGGQAYYIELIYKEIGGGDFGMVAARPEGGGIPVGGNDQGAEASESISSLILPSPFCTIGPGAVPAGVSGSVTITQQPTDRTNQANTQTTFTVAATTANAPYICYQWERSDDGGGTFNPIPGATGTSYTTGYLTEAADHNDRYRLQISVPGQTVTSAEARLTVTADTVRPRVTRVLSINDTNIVVFYSEPLPGGMSIPAGNADESFAYTVDDGNTIVVGSAMISPSNPLRVDLFLSDSGLPMTLGNTYTLRVSNDDFPIADAYNNALNPHPTFVTFRAQNFSGNVETLLTLGTEGMLPVGSLTDRGFAGRIVQVPFAKPNGNATTESVLAGTFTNTLGELGLNIAPLPVFFETNIINYDRFAPTGTAVGSLSPDANFPGYSITTANFDSITMEVITYLHLGLGIYRFGVNSDDGFRVSPAVSANDPNDSITVGQFDGGRGTADTLFDFYVGQEGLYPFRLIWEQGTGGANLEWWQVDLNTTGAPRVAINANPPAPPAPGLAASPGGGGPPAFTPPCTPKNLGVSLSGGNLVVTWPIAGGGNLFALQGTPSLNPVIAWSYVPQVPQNIAGNKRVTIPLTAGQNRFYRLYKPAPPNCL